MNNVAYSSMGLQCVIAIIPKKPDEKTEKLNVIN